MKYLIALILLASANSFASGFHYCRGKITEVVTRATHHATSVEIDGMKGAATLGFGGASFEEMHERQFSMILSAFISGKEVTLEFLDNSISCADDHTDTPIRFVRLRD